jgi:hypothetical protein
MGQRGFAAIGLWAVTQSWIAEELTDGRIPSRQPMRLLGEDPTDAIAALIEVGLWERAGDDLQVHDYLHYNPAREKVLADRAQRSLAGKIGADARWGADGEPHGKSHSEPHGDVPNEMHGGTDAPVPVYPVTKSQGTCARARNGGRRRNVARRCSRGLS